MWFLYVPVITLVLVAAGSAMLGAFVVAAPALILALVLALVALVARSRTLRLNAVEAPGGIPDSRGAAYEPRQDPRTTATGSSTGTP